MKKMKFIIYLFLLLNALYLGSIETVHSDDCSNASNILECECTENQGGTWNQTTQRCETGSIDPNGSEKGSIDPNTRSLINPLKATDITTFLLNIIEILLVFALPIIVLFIMYAGFLFVTAQGNEGQVSKAKSALTWAIIGGVIALSAKLIIDLIQNTVTALGA